jgi:hypothetical protein
MGDIYVYYRCYKLYFLSMELLLASLSVHIFHRYDYLL